MFNTRHKIFLIIFQLKMTAKMTPIPPNFQTAFVGANLFSRRLIALRRKIVHRTLFLYAVPSHMEHIKKDPKRDLFLWLQR